MKYKIVTGLLFCAMLVNVAGCGCGTTKTADSEPEVVAEVESEVVQEETEVDDVAPLEDYADSLVEIEGGDGEEVSAEETTEVVEETPAEEAAEEPEEVFEPYFMFTNTGANVRAQASKESELVGTAPINTEVKVVGVEGNWSNVEFNGLSAYIKSSLLSKDKTEVASSNTGGSSGSGNTQADNGGNTAPAPSQPSQPAPSPGNGLPPVTSTLGSVPTGGTSDGCDTPNMGGCY